MRGGTENGEGNENGRREQRGSFCRGGCFGTMTLVSSSLSLSRVFVSGVRGGRGRFRGVIRVITHAW